MILKRIKFLLPKSLFPEFFLDWNLDNWLAVYRNQTNLLEIFHKNICQQLPQVIVFDNTKDKLDINSFSFQLQSDKFKIERSLETQKLFELYKRFIWLHKRKLFNEACLRLVDVKVLENSTSAKKIIFETQAVDYFNYIQTNLCLDARLKPKSKTLREKLHVELNDHQLEELHCSLLANPLGINILVFTIDGTLILQKRSPYTLVRPNEICSSVSGTLTPSDISSSNNDPQLKSLLLSFFREGFEELGLNESDINVDTVSFLGIARELIRGGQPEVFLSAHININESETLDRYKQARDKFESQSLLFFKMSSLATEPLNSSDKQMAFHARVDELLEKYGNLVAVPLWANLAFWCKMRLN